MLIPDIPDIFTTDPTSTRFHACRHMSLSSSLASNSSLKYIASPLFKYNARRNRRLTTSEPITACNLGVEEILKIKPSVQWFSAQGAAVPAKYFHQPVKVEGVWVCAMLITLTY